MLLFKAALIKTSKQSSYFVYCNAHFYRLAQNKIVCGRSVHPKIISSVFRVNMIRKIRRYFFRNDMRLYIYVYLRRPSMHFRLNVTITVKNDILAAFLSI